MSTLSVGRATTLSSTLGVVSDVRSEQWGLVSWWCQDRMVLGDPDKQVQGGWRHGQHGGGGDAECWGDYGEHLSSGAATLSSTLGVVSDVSVGAVGARKLVVSGSGWILGDQTNKFKVDGDTGDTVVAGTLERRGRLR